MAYPVVPGGQECPLHTLCGKTSISPSYFTHTYRLVRKAFLSGLGARSSLHLDIPLQQFRLRRQHREPFGAKGTTGTLTQTNQHIQTKSELTHISNFTKHMHFFSSHERGLSSRKQRKSSPCGIGLRSQPPVQVPSLPASLDRTTGSLSSSSPPPCGGSLI